jgi:hypothetical protein
MGDVSEGATSTGEGTSTVDGWQLDPGASLVVGPAAEGKTSLIVVLEGERVGSALLTARQEHGR